MATCNCWTNGPMCCRNRQRFPYWPMAPLGTYPPVQFIEPKTPLDDYIEAQEKWLAALGCLIVSILP